MTEQQNHLKSVVDQQKELFKEIQELNNQLTVKREMAIKLQGIYEYLTGTGVELPKESENLSEESSEVVNEVGTEK